MRSQAYAFLLGVVAIFAGVATMAASSIRSIDIFGGALVLGGLGSTAWATGDKSLFKMFIGVLLMTTLIGGVVELLDVDLLASTSLAVVGLAGGRSHGTRTEPPTPVEVARWMRWAVPQPAI